MGMFDDVLYEAAMPLPDGYQGKNFQTKEFGCDMAQYRISPEGRVMQPLDEDDSPAGVFSSGKVARWRDMHFHGWLHFYTFVNKRPGQSISQDNPGDWHGYHAKFTDGQLVAIECDNQTANSPSTTR